jgi:hypothetical protein
VFRRAVLVGDPLVDEEAGDFWVQREHADP